MNRDASDAPIGRAVRPDWVPSNLYPFADRWMEIEGNQVHYVDEGQGPVLLFLHGNPTWSFLYRRQILDLHDRFRCIAVDYPGFGLSRARPGYDFTPREHSKVVEKLVGALALREITLMVQDWGGPIGLGMACRRPELVKALVIGSTWAWPAQGDPDMEPFSRFMGGPIGGFLIRRLNVFLRVLLPGGMTRKLSRQEKRAYRGPFRTSASREPVAVFPREILASREYLAEVEAGLPRIADRPVLIIWGTKDVAFKEKERRRFESIFPNHRTVILENANHLIQEDAPERVTEEIQRWSSAL